MKATTLLLQPPMIKASSHATKEAAFAPVVVYDCVDEKLMGKATALKKRCSIRCINIDTTTTER